MTRYTASILALILAAPLAALAADKQVNLNTATNISIPTTAGVHSATAFRIDSAHEGWVTRVSNEALCTPAYGAGKLFLGGGYESHSFFAFNASTGKLEWQVGTTDNGPTAAVVEDNNVVFNTESCHIENLAADTGKTIWSELIGVTLQTQPAVADGKVFTTHPLGDSKVQQGMRYKMLCMDLKTGQHCWDADISGDVLSTPVVADHMVYFTCTDGQAFCLKEDTGGMEWQEKYLGTAAPLVANAQVLMTVKDAAGNEGLKRFDAKAGDAKDAELLTHAKVSSVTLQRDSAAVWNYQGPRPVVAKGHVITAEGNAVTSINLETGKPEWRVAFHSFGAGWGANMFNPVALGAERIYLASTDGHLVCLDQADGKLVFNYATGQKIATQPILAEGNIYVATADGRLVCLKLNDKDADGWYAWGGNAAHNKGP